MFGFSNSGYSFERDIREAQAMADALSRYVDGNELYGNVGSGGIFSGGSMPKLTLGALWMRIRRLHALRDRLTDDQRQTLREIEHINADVMQEKRSRYERKLVYEAESRLKAMEQFFEECRRNRSECANIYKPEALRRTIVQEILLVMQRYGIESEDIPKKIRSVDSRLRSLTQPTDFLWDDVLKPAYDEPTYWWLYQAPPRT